MPEGPSIIILKKNIQQFKGKKVLQALGYAEIDYSELENKTVTDIKTWGKHLLICFKKVTVRIHLMLFGSYIINKHTSRKVKFGLEFNSGNVNFYACRVDLLHEDIDTIYDWTADIMSDAWSNANAKKKLKQFPETIIADALMDQHIFSGVGNIIKNEIMWRARVHPQTKVGNLPLKKMNEIIKEARLYSFEFLEQKQANTLSKHWNVYSKKMCPRCKIPLHKEYLGKAKRRSFYCENCQVKYE
ncbi:MAG: DNA-formamidopyrimidine glycosylase family protein [Parafilimonas sp.]